MVGDRAGDISAARTHGIRSIGAVWGYGGAGELAGAGADLLCERPQALAACLGRLGR
jgi:phosphoglycolate phosphatase